MTRFHLFSRKRSDFLPRECPLCHVTFTPHVWNQAYCCPEHGIRHRSQKRDARKKAERQARRAALRLECPFCHELFKPTRSFQKICRKYACQRAAANERKYRFRAKYRTPFNLNFNPYAEGGALSMDANFCPVI